MKIVMIGSGYVGLVSGTCLADFGHDVTCVDLDVSKIDRLNNGEIPIFEPGLHELVEHNVNAGRLHFTTDLKAAVSHAAAVFICVGTPPRPEDGHADMKYVHAAARSIAEAADGFTVIVNKSTVPVGTGDAVASIVAEYRPSADIAVASNPEFLREGAAIHDFKFPDRVVIGTEEERARVVMEEIYRPLATEDSPIMFTGRRTAELIKYAANALLATKITFINEVADLCEKAGGNVVEVARGIGLDSRIGPKFLDAGPGYGGSCFPKDTLALVKTAEEYGANIKIVETVVAVNDQRKRNMAQKIITACGGDVKGKTIAVLGYTFKPDTDDMRESPAITIIEELQAAGASIRAYDPEGEHQARTMLGNVEFAADAFTCVTNADCVVLITEWSEFKTLDMKRVRSVVRQPVLVDLRNIYKPDAMRELGFTYESIGRPAKQQATVKKSKTEAA